MLEIGWHCLIRVGCEFADHNPRAKKKHVYMFQGMKSFKGVGGLWHCVTWLWPCCTQLYMAVVENLAWVLDELA